MIPASWAGPRPGDIQKRSWALQGLGRIWIIEECPGVLQRRVAADGRLLLRSRLRAVLNDRLGRRISLINHDLLSPRSS